MRKKKQTFDNLQFPVVKNVQPRTIAQDIFPYIPGDKKNMKAWDKIFKDTFDPIKKMYKEAGIPMPTIVIDSTPGPITYGVKTVDKDGNVIHTQFENKHGKD